MKIKDCQICQGKGTIDENKCHLCAGLGKIWDDEGDDKYFPVIETIKSIDISEYHDPCAGCSNNPKNNPYASGVCGCTLPYMNRPTL